MFQLARVAEEDIDDKEKARVERAIRRDNAQKYYQRGETARLAED